MSDSGDIVPATAWADVELAHQRALEVNWAMEAQHNPRNFGEFATAGSILMREQFGENFSGMVQGRNIHGDITTVGLEFLAGDTVRVQPLDSVKAGELAQRAADEGEPPTSEEMAEIATDDPGVLVPIGEFVKQALGSGEVLVCDICEKAKTDVVARVDPFASQVRDDYSLRLLCNECTDTRRDDI